MKTIIALAILITVVCSCSHQLAPVGHFQDSAVTADGNLDDWTLPLRFSNPEHSFQYSVTNDSRNIYICILSKNEATQLRILRSGINIYFDPKGEQHKNISLEFPLNKPEQSNYSDNGNPITSSGTKIAKDQLLLQSDYYNTTGFANIENGQFGVGDKKSNIEVSLKLHDDTTLVYEAIIPIADVPGAELSGKKGGKNFSIGITLNAPSRRNAQRSNSPRPSVGMRGMRMGGGGYRGGANQSYQQPKEEINWYIFRLAGSNQGK